MNSLVVERLIRYAPFVVAASASFLMLAHGLHFGPLDEVGMGPPN
jgi:hypothetical protein